jgi:chromosome segregation ATPase
MCLLAVSVVPTQSILAQATPKKNVDDSAERLRRAKARFETGVMKRIADIMEAEAKGKDIRTELEKARDNLGIARYQDEAYLQDVTKLATAITERQAEILEAKKKGKDIRTEVEKTEAALVETAEKDADHVAARKRLLAAIKERETALQKAKDAGKDIRSEFEKAVQKFDAAVENAPDYKAAVKRLMAVQADGSTPDGPLAPSRSAPYRVAWTRLIAELTR